MVSQIISTKSRGTPNQFVPEMKLISHYVPWALERNHHPLCPCRLQRLRVQRARFVDGRGGQQQRRNERSYLRRQLRPQLQLGRRGAGAQDEAQAQAAAQQDIILRRTDRAIGKR